MRIAELAVKTVYEEPQQNDKGETLQTKCSTVLLLLKDAVRRIAK